MTNKERLHQKKMEALVKQVKHQIKESTRKLQSSGNVSSSWGKCVSLRNLIDCGHLNYNEDRKIKSILRVMNRISKLKA